MFDPNYDPMAIIEQMQINQAQLDHNQKQIVLAINQWQKTAQEHEQRLDLNQETINQLLNSIQNQYTLLMALFEQINHQQSVNTTKGQDDGQATDNNKKQ
jgi:flagellar capping protein FliD